MRRNLPQAYAAIDAAIAAFGGIDILVNNVGGGEAQGPVEDFTEAEFDDMIALNVKSAFFLSQRVGRHMIARGKGGRIINMSSQAAFIALPTEAIYCACKAAVSHMTKCFAVEWGKHNDHGQRRGADLHRDAGHRAGSGRPGVRGRRRRADRGAAPDRRAEGSLGRGGVPRLARRRR